MSGECSSAGPSDGFVDKDIGYEANEFWVEFDATPSAAPIDGVIGFADGAADGFSDLATAVRFGPEGMIDARDGDTYRVYPGPVLAYQAGVKYHFRVQTKISAHTYSATVTAPDGSFSWLASDAAFRPTQANVMQLTESATKIDSASGSVSVCGYTETFHDQCRRIDAGAGWIDAPPSWPSVGTATFSAQMKATQTNVDAVLGLSNGPADAFTDLAAIVRFNPSGTVDARNGSSYQAVDSLPYAPGTLYPVSVSLDIRQHRYSATVGGVVIAKNYAFRSEQAGVARLDDSGSFIDSASGGIIVCNPKLTSIDRALYSVPSQGGRLVVGRDGKLYETSETSASLVVRDSATGTALQTAPLRGRGRTDSAGNLYLAGSFSGTYDPGTGPLTSSGGSDVFVAKYTGDLTPIWARVLGTSDDDAFRDLAVDGLGRVTVLGPTIGTVVFDSCGNPIRTTQDSATDIAADGIGELALVGGRAAGNGWEIWVEKRDPSGQTLWQNVYPLSNVSKVSLSDAGEVVFSGTFSGTVNFGGSDLEWTVPGEGPANTGYLVKLSADGAHVWSLQNDYHYQLSDVTVDHAGNVTFSGTEGSQIYYPTLIKYAAADGAPLWRQSDEDTRGTTQSIATDDAGAIYWCLTHDDYAQGTSDAFLRKLAP